MTRGVIKMVKWWNYGVNVEQKKTRKALTDYRTFSQALGLDVNALNVERRELNTVEVVLVFKNYNKSFLGSPGNGRRVFRHCHGTQRLKEAEKRLDRSGHRSGPVKTGSALSRVTMGESEISYDRRYNQHVSSLSDSFWIVIPMDDFP